MYENFEKMKSEELINFRKLVEAKKRLALVTIRANNLKLEALEEEMIALVKCNEQEELRMQSSCAEDLHDEKYRLVQSLETLDSKLERIDRNIIERGLANGE